MAMQLWTGICVQVCLLNYMYHAPGQGCGKNVLQAGLKTWVGLESDDLNGKDMSQVLRHRVTGALQEVAALDQTRSNRNWKPQLERGPDHPSDSEVPVMAKHTDVRQAPQFREGRGHFLLLKCFRWGCEYWDISDLHKEEDSLPLTFTMSIQKGEPITRAHEKDPSRASAMSGRNCRPCLRQHPRPLPKFPATDKGEATKQELWDDGADLAWSNAMYAMWEVRAGTEPGIPIAGDCRGGLSHDDSLNSPLDGRGPLQFEITASGEDYLDLSRCYFKIKFKVVNEDGMKMDSWVHNADGNMDKYDMEYNSQFNMVLVIFMLHSMFRQVDLALLTLWWQHPMTHIPTDPIWRPCYQGWAKKIFLEYLEYFLLGSPWRTRRHL